MTRQRLRVGAPIGRVAGAGWLLALVLGALAVAWCYPRAFPYAPRDWSVDKEEAVRIVEERLRDLGPAVVRPYITATLTSDAALELRLAASGGVPATLRGTRLGRRLTTWRVSVYERGAAVGDWSYLATVALDGEVLSLLRGGPRAPAAAELQREDAVVRADRLLVEQGFDLSTLGPPSERRVDLPDAALFFVRYVDLERAIANLEYGVEVRFAGDQLLGFQSWHQDPQAGSFERRLRASTLTQTVHGFVLFLLLPFLIVLFVRLYHQGVVGVRRGLQVFALVFTSSAVALLLTARAVAEGSSLGNTTRPQVTWIFATVMLLVYLPTLATTGFIGAAVGEAWSRGTWRTRLASFDALLGGAWGNSTVAASAVRGTAVGVWLAAAALAVVLVARPWGGVAPFALALGPGWHHASLPGVALLLVTGAFALAYTCLGRLLLLPPLVDRWGLWLGGGLVTVATGLGFFAPVELVPLVWGLPVRLLWAAVLVACYYRFDLVTSLQASLISSVALEAMPLVYARDPGIELQGWLALGLAAAPLFASVRFLGAGREYPYRYDDVPPHVRKIAERERQRVELETARRIQSSILPALPATLGGVALAHIYLPATEVGGDFYDVLELGDGRLAVAIGDVAGHGVSSGLIMSMARAALAVQVTFQPEVEAVFGTLNRIVFESADRRLLTTLCYAILDPARRSFTWACAGHLFPYRVSRRGAVEALESIAYPLGVRALLEVEVRSCELAAGDSLFLASDGLVEARRVDAEEPFGFVRLEQSLARHAGGAEQLKDGVLADLERFVGAGRILDPEVSWREDDLTILVLELPA